MSGRTLHLMVGGRIALGIGAVREVELREKLGEGGFGQVWRVTDCATGAPYALKIIQGLKPGSVEEERARREAGVSIPSEYIVPVIGLCEWDPFTYLILFEYYRSTPLDQLIAEGRLTDARKKHIFKQVLYGVSDAHRSNVIHRDLKPGNVLVGEGDAVKLIDFGVSKFKGKGLTMTGDIIGTIPYMALELIVEGARAADARADIYALGHILYELTVGRHFWEVQGWTRLNDMLAYITRTPPPTEAIDLSGFSCALYPGATEALARMVRINPEERYSAVDDILADLGYIPNLPEPPKDLHLRYPLLIVESGSNRGSRTLVSIGDGCPRVFGRADIAATDTSISREHLEFRRAGDRYFLRDLSKNGTMVRGLMLMPGDPPMEVRHADRIKVGDVFLRFAFLRDI